MENIDFFKDQTPVSDLYVKHAKDFLANNFLFLTKDFIFQTLSQQKNHLMPTFLKLNEYQFSSPVRMEIANHCCHRGVEHYDPLSFDARFENERKFIIELEKNNKEVRIMSILRKKNLIQRVCLGKENTRCGCGKEFDPLELIYCPNRHGSCRGCIRKSVTDAKRRGFPTYVCLHQECGVEYMDAELRKVFSPQELDKLYAWRLVWEAKKAFKDNFQQCPDCAWGCFIDVKSMKIFHCGNKQCLKDWCMQCWGRAHDKEMCPVEKRRIEEEEEARRFPPLMDLVRRDVTGIAEGLGRYEGGRGHAYPHRIKTLYHATLGKYAAMIREQNFFKSSGPANDIGPGIYFADLPQQAYGLADGAGGKPDVYFECLIDVGEILQRNTWQGDVKQWQGIEGGRYGSIYQAPQWAVRDNGQILKFVLRQYGVQG